MRLWIRGETRSPVPCERGRRCCPWRVGGGSQRVAQRGSLILTSFAELPSCSGLGAEYSIAPADDPFCRK